MPPDRCSQPRCPPATVTVLEPFGTSDAERYAPFVHPASSRPDDPAHGAARSRYIRRMLIGGLVFAVVAILCIFVGVVVLKRRSDYGNSDGDDVMSDAEFRKIEGFDE